jgi:hypothetical protein
LRWALFGAALVGFVALPSIAADGDLVQPSWIATTIDDGCSLLPVFRSSLRMPVIGFQAGPLSGQKTRLVVIDSSSKAKTITLESPSIGIVEAAVGQLSSTDETFVERFKQDVAAGQSWRVRTHEPDRAEVTREIGAGNGELAALMFDACVAARPVESPIVSTDRLVPGFVEVVGSKGFCGLSMLYEREEMRWTVTITGKRSQALIEVSAKPARDPEHARIDLSGLGGPGEALFGETYFLDGDAAANLRRSLARRAIIVVPLKFGDHFGESLPIGGPEMQTSVAMFEACWAKLRQ